MKTRRTLAALCCVLAAALTGEARAAAKSSPLVRAGDLAVSKEEFLAYARREKIQNLAALSLEQRRALAIKLTVRKALAQDAEKKGYAREPAVEKALFQWKVRHYPDAFWLKEVDKKVTVSDAELRAIINPQEEFLLSAMLFAGDEDGLQKAREVAALLAAGGNFVELAKQRSQGLSASKGGDMGWQTIPNQSVGDKEATFIRLTKVGGFTAPLETQVGWAIYWVRDHHSADDVFKQERESARPELLAQKIRVARASRMQQLRDGASISYTTEMPGLPKGTPLAIVDGQIIQPDTTAAGEGQHGVSATVAPKEQLEKFVDAYLVTREAERLGIGNDPELRRQEQLERMEVLAQVAIRKESERDLVITEAAMRAEYRRYYVPDVYELQVVVGYDRAKIDAAHKSILGGASFDAVAERGNDTWLAKNKGRLPLAPIVDYPPEFQAAVAALPDGGVSGVLPLGDGRWVVVKRLAKQTVTVPTYEEAAPAIRGKLTIKGRADRVKEFVESYRKKLGIVVDDELLRKL